MLHQLGQVADSFKHVDFLSVLVLIRLDGNARDDQDEPLGESWLCTMTSFPCVVVSIVHHWFVVAYFTKEVVGHVHVTAIMANILRHDEACIHMHGVSRLS